MTLQIPDPLWCTLVEFVPAASKLEKKDRASLCGYVRRALLTEAAEEQDSLAVYQSGDAAGLRKLIRSLPAHTPAELAAVLEELDLTPEEAAMEAAAWPFRHQARSGELLFEQELIPFKLIRMKPHTFVLMIRTEHPRVIEDFSGAFERAPQISSARAFRVEGQAWSAWAWLLDPDAGAVAREAEQLRQMWSGEAS